MNIIYRTDIKPKSDEIIQLYISAGLNRPVTDKQRIKEMYDHSNLIVTAWNNDKLVGISRSLTDFVYCCYLSDLAVNKEYQSKGIGKKLIEITKEKAGGTKTTLILLSAPSAIEYYPKIGLEKSDNCFKLLRAKELSK